ncbi:MULTISPECIES: hypothetical protein [unclassified Sphingomonas]|uniref:hypothetical protein n=1 Tax=unclassified Sphingomonas TaxID=196159 RepID=UPI002269DD0C|nr:MULTISPECIES: hypothetical protein [unclassified Sphingomonas]
MKAFRCLFVSGRASRRSGRPAVRAPWVATFGALGSSTFLHIAPVPADPDLPDGCTPPYCPADGRPVAHGGQEENEDVEHKGMALAEAHQQAELAPEAEWLIS